jgi:recombination protein RecA
MYGEGISKEGNLIDVGVEYEIVQKGGAWYSYGDVKLGQGRDASKNFLKDNPEIRDEIEAKIREKAGIVEHKKFEDNVLAVAKPVNPKKK